MYGNAAFKHWNKKWQGSAAILVTKLMGVWCIDGSVCYSIFVIHLTIFKALLFKGFDCSPLYTWEEVLLNYKRLTSVTICLGLHKICSLTNVCRKYFCTVLTLQRVLAAAIFFFHACCVIPVVFQVYYLKELFPQKLDYFEEPQYLYCTFLGATEESGAHTAWAVIRMHSTLACRGAFGEGQSYAWAVG